jgi:hypothetical protein
VCRVLFVFVRQFVRTCSNSVRKRGWRMGRKCWTEQPGRCRRASPDNCSLWISSVMYSTGNADSLGFYVGLPQSLVRHGRCRPRLVDLLCSRMVTNFWLCCSLPFRTHGVYFGCSRVPQRSRARQLRNITPSHLVGGCILAWYLDCTRGLELWFHPREVI